MFERFNDAARRVLVRAQEHSRTLKHDRIGPEHILLGLIDENNVAASAFGDGELSLERAAALVIELIGRGDAEVAGSLPFSPEAKRLLELALREALQLGHRFIGAEHLLLALVRQEDPTVVEVLERLGADTKTARQTILLRGQPGFPFASVRPQDVTPIDGAPAPSALLTPEDVEAVWQEHGYRAASATGERLADGVRFLWSSWPPVVPPTPTLGVAVARVTAAAFDRYSEELGPARCVPVDGVGDRATFDPVATSLRVLSGSTLFVVALTQPSAGALDICAALARRVLARLEG